VEPAVPMADVTMPNLGSAGLSEHWNSVRFVDTKTGFGGSHVSRVTREPLEVAYVETGDNPADIQAAWPLLEGLVGALRGRHFYGSFDPFAGIYRACVVVGEGDQLPAEAQQTLARGVLPGGDYLRLRLRGEPPQVYELISPAFDHLTSLGTPDHSRPSLEHYRRRNEIDALLPVASAAS
jgi:hypothetical protein